MKVIKIQWIIFLKINNKIKISKIFNNNNKFKCSKIWFLIITKTKILKSLTFLIINNLVSILVNKEEFKTYKILISNSLIKINKIFLTKIRLKLIVCIWKNLKDNKCVVNNNNNGSNNSNNNSFINNNKKIL